MAWYATGTISIANGSMAVTGTGTQFVGNVQPGDGLVVAGLIYQIAVVDDATHLTLAKPFAGSTASGLLYEIQPSAQRDIDLQEAILAQNATYAQLIEDRIPIQPNTVNNGDLTDMPPATFKGRYLGSTGDPQDMTAGQAKALLNIQISDIESGNLMVQLDDHATRLDDLEAGTTGGSGGGSGDGSGVPDGGSTGQVLAKASNVSGDVEWIDVEVSEGGSFPEAPIDSKIYGRKDGIWTEVVPAAFWSVEATGTGISQQVTLPRSGLTVNDVQVFVDTLRQAPSSYSIAANKLVITTNATGDKILINGLTGQATSLEVIENDSGGSGGLNLPPSDGKVYAMMNGAWVDITAYINGVPGSAVSKKWRLYVTSHMGGALVSISELYLFTDETPTDVATTGTATQSSQYGSFAPANFLDRNQSSFASLTTSGPLPGWFQVEFATAKSIVGMGIVPRGDETNNSPKNFLLQYENGGVWETLISVSGDYNWTSGVRKDYFESVVFPE